MQAVPLGSKHGIFSFNKMSKMDPGIFKMKSDMRTNQRLVALGDEKALQDKKKSDK